MLVICELIESHGLISKKSFNSWLKWLSFAPEQLYAYEAMASLLNVDVLTHDKVEVSPTEELLYQLEIKDNLVKPVAERHVSRMCDKCLKNAILITMFQNKDNKHLICEEHRRWADKKNYNAIQRNNIAMRVRDIISMYPNGLIKDDIQEYINKSLEFVDIGEFQQ